MSKAMTRNSILPAQAIKDLANAKQQILEAVVGAVPEQLVRATVGAAVRLAHQEAVPAPVLSERVIELVRQSLKALAQQRWKPDTALLLRRSLGEGHGLSE